MKVFWENENTSLAIAPHREKLSSLVPDTVYMNRAMKMLSENNSNLDDFDLILDENNIMAYKGG